MEVLQHPFLKRFDEEDAKRLDEIAQTQAYAEGTEIFKEGESSDVVFLVLEGKIDLVKSSPKGEVRVATCEGGGYFGEMGVFDGQGRSTGAVAAVDTKMALIPGGPFIELLKESRGAMLFEFVGDIMDHVRRTNTLFLEQMMRKQKLSTIGEMAGKIIHDLRGPMTSLSLGVELIQMDPEPAEIKRTCDMMLGQVKRMSGMAEELLEFARGSHKIDLMELNLEALLHTFHLLNADYLKKIEFGFEVLPKEVYAAVDEGKLTRVLQNLVNNSVDALKKRENPKIIMKCFEEGDDAVITIEDNGPGIPEEIRDKLFDAFVTHGKSSGTGLGLAIAKAIVEAHNGRISLDTGSSGTTFTLRLPKV